MAIRRGRTVAVFGVVLLIAIGAIWAIASSGGDQTDSVVAVAALPEELSVKGLKEQVADPSSLRKKVRETMEREDLTDEQRDQLRKNIREVMRAEMDKRVDEFLEGFSIDKSMR